MTSTTGEHCWRTPARNSAEPEVVWQANQTGIWMNGELVGFPEVSREMLRLAKTIKEDEMTDVERRMRSPYTRAEFVAREVEAGIEAQGVLGVDVKFCDLDPDAATAIRQRAEWNAQAAERAGITWRTHGDEPVPSMAARTSRITMADIVKAHHDLGKSAEGKRLDDLTRRVAELEQQSLNLASRVADRISILEQQVAQPIVAEIRDQAGARTAYHAIEERTKDEIRALIRETVFGGPLSTSVSQNLLQRVGALEQQVDPCPLIAEHDRRLSLQLERITELANRLNRELGEFDPDGYSVKEQIASVFALTGNTLQRVERIESEWKIEGQKLATDRAKLRSFVVDGVGRELEMLRELVVRIANTLYEDIDNPDAETGIVGVVRHLDADMALIRDAVCPPQDARPKTLVGDPRYIRAAREVDAWLGDVPVVYSDDAAVANPSQEQVVEEEHAHYKGNCPTCGNPCPCRQRTTVYSQKDRDLLVDRLGKYAEYLRQTRDALRAACLELGADATWSVDTNLADVVSKVLVPHVREHFDKRTRHDDLAYALGRAYMILKGLRVYENEMVEEEMEAIRQVLGNNWRDWLRPREAG